MSNLPLRTVEPTLRQRVGFYSRIAFWLFIIWVAWPRITEYLL